MNLIDQTCCFTGHRNIPVEAVALLSQRLDETIRGLIGGGLPLFRRGRRAGI